MQSESQKLVRQREVDNPGATIETHPAARKLPVKPTQGTRPLLAQPVRKKRP